MTAGQPEHYRRQATPGRAATSFLRIAGLPLFALAVLTACTGAEPDPEKEQMGPDAAKATSAAKTATQSNDVASAAEEPLSETDRLMLDQAKTACKNADFKQFFEAVLRAQAVRERYFPAPIQTASRKVAVSEYRFPIQIMDYSYIVAGSEQRGPNNWEYVKLEFNQAQDERYRVDWVRVDFGPNGDDEGATPEDDREYGPRGYLLFYPTKECWTLVEDGVE